MRRLGGWGRSLSRSAQSEGFEEGQERQARPSELADRRAGYENAAERLGAIALDDQARAAAHLEQQVQGDALRDGARGRSGR